MHGSGSILHHYGTAVCYFKLGMDLLVWRQTQCAFYSNRDYLKILQGQVQRCFLNEVLHNILLILYQMTFGRPDRSLRYHKDDNLATSVTSTNQEDCSFEVRQ